MWLSFNSHYVLHPSRENMGRPRPQTNDVALQKKRQVSTSISGNYFIPTMLVDKDFCTSTCFCSPYLPLPERNIFRWPTQLIPSCFSHYLNKTCHKLSCQKISQINHVSLHPHREVTSICKNIIHLYHNQLCIIKKEIKPKKNAIVLPA